MTKIEVELHEDVISIIHKLKNVADTGVELIVPEGAVLFDNILNLKLLRNWSDQEGKVINFQTDDVGGQNLLMSLEEEASFPEEITPENVEAIEEEVPAQKFAMPKMRLTLPVIKLKKGKIFLVLIIVAGLLGVVGVVTYRYVSRLPQAHVKIVVNSQPLTRSFEIKVISGHDTSADEKILKGTTLEAGLDDEVIVETTGEKIVGEKAKGEITIYNKTTEEKKFKKGTDIIYRDKDDDKFVYELRDDITVGPSVDDPGPPPGEIWGSADVEVEAKEIGKDYNIDKGEDLEVEDQDDSDFVAKVNKDIDGGKEETIKIVAQEDMDKAIQTLQENSKEKALKALDQKITGDQKLISGSENVAVVKETFSHKLGDETEELKLSQTFSAKCLTYVSGDLNTLVDTLTESFVPEGFELSDKERAVNVEVLGNTETTLLNDSEADLQVTLKTFVVTDISEDSIKQALMGLTVNEAEKYLGSIRNVKTYELSINPHVPFFDNVPKDESRIIINLERE